MRNKENYKLYDQQLGKRHWAWNNQEGFPENQEYLTFMEKMDLLEELITVLDRRHIIPLDNKTTTEEIALLKIWYDEMLMLHSDYPKDKYNGL